ncbi:hypothetical protein N7494_004162 [Penicillium frequentans]|uniref:BZIP domain-containing protein n=1 Tax=Penicillium frequentans TaxID=3151616 RepID=A0AAD6D044_9EURO|nr:hypothetical protein N7494_004162 [Penicillium glabrum]
MATTSDQSISTIDLPKATPTTDAAAKRRLQNRLNQRASRERRALKAGKQNNKQKRWIIYTEGAKAHAEPELVKSDHMIISSIPPKKPTHNLCHLKTQTSATIADWNARKHYLIAQLEQRVASAAANQLNQLTLLAPVTNLNIVNAMLINATFMGLTLELLGEEIVSTFNIPGPMTLQLPPSLQPTSTQIEIHHHPWIDLMPMKSFRDVLLKNLDKYDEDDFCGDLHGQIGASNGIGLISWGEPWDPSAYEISEGVFRKWAWLLKECPEIIRTTNHWRRIRGEKPLHIGQPVGFVHSEEVQE